MVPMMTLTHEELPHRARRPSGAFDQVGDGCAHLASVREALDETGQEQNDRGEYADCPVGG